MSYYINLRLIICDAFSDLVPLVQFKKREKHPWRNDTFDFNFLDS